MKKQQSTLVDQLVLIFSQNNNNQKMINYALKNYHILLYKIEKLQPHEILTMYNGISLKSYGHPTLYSEEFWFENELKVFIWTLVAFSHQRQLLIQNFVNFQLYQTDQQWLPFSHTFNHRPIDFFQFQANFIFKSNPLSKSWTKDEEKDQISNKWNFVARQLFKLSDRNYYKTPKQCRQRWLNHLDPSKKHTPWTIDEDIKLFKCVKSIGKKWAQISKIFQNTRTEHMIKNRFNGVTYSYAKKYHRMKEEQVVEKFLNLHQTQKNSNKQKNVEKKTKPSAKNSNRTVPRHIRTSPINRTHLIEIRDDKNSEILSEQKLPININIQTVPNEESFINKDTKMSIQDKIFEEFIDIEQQKRCDILFFEDVEFEMPNIPFLIENEDVESFISKCIHSPVVDHFEQKKMLGENMFSNLPQ